MKNSRVVCGAILIVFLASIFLASRIQVGIRAEDWLDQRLASTQRFLEMKSIFGSEDKLTWVVPSDFSQQSLCQWQQKSFEWAASDTHLKSLSSIFDLRSPLYKSQNKILLYPRVLDENCKFGDSEIATLKMHPLFDAMSVQKGKDLLFNFTFEELEVPTKWGKTNFEVANEWIDKLHKEEPSALFGGSLYFQKSTRDGIQWAGKLNLLTALIILVSCRVFLGTWLSGIILAFFVFFTTSSLQAGMVLRKEVVDPLSSCIFILMSIAVIEDYFFAFHLARLKKIKLRTALRRMCLPGFFTSLTTAFGFGALITSENMSVQNLGFWTALGTMIECSLIFLFLPALTKVFPSIDQLPTKGTVLTPRWLSYLGSIKPTRRGVVILCLPLLLIFVTFDKVNINYTPFDMFKKSHPLIQFRDYLKDQRGFEGDVSLVFDKKDLDAEDSKIISEVAKHPLVADFTDPYLVTQKLMPADVDEPLKRLISHEVKSATTLKSYFNEGKSRAILYVHSIDIKSIESLANHTDEICKGRCHLSGEIVAFKDYSLSILKTLYSSFISSLIPVILTMAFLCLASSGRIHWPIIISTAWAPAMLLILVSLLQIKINVVTCVALSLLIGLAGDNAIQFLLFDRHGKWTKGLDQLKHSTLLIMFVMSMIALTLLLSYFRSAQILSGLVLLGIFLLLVGELWILNHFTAKIEETDSQKRQ